MRDMTEQEILDFIKEWRWGTILAVEGDKPYGVEVSYASDDDYIYCGTRPGGRMADCIRANRNTAFKICDSDAEHKKWRAVIVEGVSEKIATKEEMLVFLKLLAKKFGRPEDTFNHMADKTPEEYEQSNTMRIPLKVISGKTNWE